MRRILYILLCLLPALSGKAQKVYNDQVSIENMSVTRGDDNRLTIAMDLILNANINIASNRAVTFIPLLKTDNNNKVLPFVVVYGRRRQLATERNQQLPKDAYKIIRRQTNKSQRINYLIQIPYEPWMQKAHILLDINQSGCCNMVEQTISEQIYRLNIEPAKPEPQIAYITPKAEAVKHRAAVGKAYLDFPVNQATINPVYRNNTSELAKIRATIDTIRNDHNTSITSISIEGFASPEGSYTSNARLADGRTKALMEYVRNYYNFDGKLLNASSTPEDWAGFRKYIETSNLSLKNEILQLIDLNETDYDAKEKKIAKFVGPEVYRTILTECYPALRHSDYTVNYSVRGFNLEEAKDIISKRPQQLSLQEIFNVAQSYDKGSKEFNHAFQIAALMFPNDKIANLNAAAMEIQKGDLSTARKYLDKADQEEAATLNNWGVVYLLEGDLTKAEEFFNKAGKAANLSEAAANTQEIIKLRSISQ